MKYRMLENNYKEHPIIEIWQGNFLEVVARLSYSSSYSIVCLDLAISCTFFMS